MGYTTEKDFVHMTELQVVFVTLIIFSVFTCAIINCNYLLHVFLIMCTISQSLASQLAQFSCINTILMYRIIYANTIRNFSSFLLCFLLSLIVLDSFMVSKPSQSSSSSPSSTSAQRELSPMEDPRSPFFLHHGESPSAILVS